MASSGPRQLLGGWRKEQPKPKDKPHPFTISTPIANNITAKTPSSSNPAAASTGVPISTRYVKASDSSSVDRSASASATARPPPPSSRGRELALDRLTGKVDDEPKSISSRNPSTHSLGDYNTQWAPTSKQTSAADLYSSRSASGSPAMNETAPSGSRRPAPRQESPTPETSSPRGPINVPRYDNRGYPVKTGSELSQASSSTPPISLSPHSSRTPITRPPSANDDFSRYPVDGDYPSTPSSKTGSPRGRVRGAPELSVNDVPSYYDANYGTESIESHLSGSDTHIEGWQSSRGDPKVAGSICDSSDSHFGEKSDQYQDFGVHVKNGRRNVVSMLHNPHNWAYLGPEDDDDMHNPEVKSKQTSIWGSLLTMRGFTNVGCLVLLMTILVVLFAGYPILTTVLTKKEGTLGAFNTGGLNATGQLPDVGPFQLIDRDTPASAYKHKSLETGEEWDLVFSDEFNRDGRSFYPGDDPYWEAEDYHYWGTQNLNWYDPAWITTRNGSLVIKLDKYPSHDLDYTGGLMTTWNRFCFSGGYIEARVVLPGKNDVPGLWPAIWTLGNLGRAGYGGTLEGMWPYTYDSCDVGTLKNQSLDGVPSFTVADGDIYNDGGFNFLPGQRLSRCSCQNSGTEHPGPKHDDGSYVGRGAPEIDIFEAQVSELDETGEGTGVWTGRVSMSGQWAPFNPGYRWLNDSTKYFELYNESAGYINTYQGGILQQSTSVLMQTNQDCYEMEKGCYSVYGFEYEGGLDGYISWVNDGKKAFTVRGASMGPNARAKVQGRPVPEEPMYIIMNLGISEAFGGANLPGLEKYWPMEMHVDYIRVYQDPAKRNIGCDPKGFPTAEYIENHKVAYFNPNISTWAQVEEQVPGAAWPRNSMIDGCKSKD